jgi:Ser/Thr protein kinase RdoA (MazF antagonist)
VVFCPSAAEFYSHILDSSLNEAISSLSNVSNINGDLDEPIEFLKSLNGTKLYNIMTRHVKDTNDMSQKQKVICHSDLWINNILFHYDTSGKPNHVKFVDLQTVRYANPVCDIM